VAILPRGRTASASVPSPNRVGCCYCAAFSAHPCSFQAVHSSPRVVSRSSCVISRRLPGCGRPRRREWPLAVMQELTGAGQQH